MRIDEGHRHLALTRGGGGGVGDQTTYIIDRAQGGGGEATAGGGGDDVRAPPHYMITCTYARGGKLQALTTVSHLGITWKTTRGRSGGVYLDM